MALTPTKRQELRDWTARYLKAGGTWKKADAMLKERGVDPLEVDERFKKFHVVPMAERPWYAPLFGILGMAQARKGEPPERPFELAAHQFGKVASFGLIQRVPRLPGETEQQYRFRTEQAPEAQPQTTPEKIAAGAGSLGGFIVGPGKVLGAGIGAVRVTPRIAGALGRPAAAILRRPQSAEAIGRQITRTGAAGLLGSGAMAVERYINEGEHPTIKQGMIDFAIWGGAEQIMPVLKVVGPPALNILKRLPVIGNEVDKRIINYHVGKAASKARAKNTGELAIEMEERGKFVQDAVDTVRAAGTKAARAARGAGASRKEAQEIADQTIEEMQHYIGRSLSQPQEARAAIFNGAAQTAAAKVKASRGEVRKVITRLRNAKTKLEGASARAKALPAHKGAQVNLKLWQERLAAERQALATSRRLFGEADELAKKHGMTPEVRARADAAVKLETEAVLREAEAVGWDRDTLQRITSEFQGRVTADLEEYVARGILSPETYARWTGPQGSLWLPRTYKIHQSLDEWLDFLAATNPADFAKAEQKAWVVSKRAKISSEISTKAAARKVGRKRKIGTEAEIPAFLGLESTVTRMSRGLLQNAQGLSFHRLLDRLAPLAKTPEEYAALPTHLKHSLHPKWKSPVYSPEVLGAKDSAQQAVRKWGSLAGKHLPADVQKTLDQFRYMPDSFMEEVIRLWKEGKTGWSPGTFARNIMTNQFFLFLNDPTAIPLQGWGAKEVVKKGSWFRLDQRQGASGSWAAAERLTVSDVDQALRKVNIFTRFGKGFGRVRREVMRGYGMTDDVTKLVSFRRGLERRIEQKEIDILLRGGKLRPERMKLVAEAADEAQRAGLNYVDVPPWVEQLSRRWVPFIRYPYAATHSLTRQALEHPSRMMALFKAPALVEMVNVQRDKVPIGQLRAALPDFLQRKDVRYWKRDEKNPNVFYFVDLTYTAPWGPGAELGLTRKAIQDPWSGLQRALEEVGSTVQPGGPALTTTITGLRGFNPLTGKPFGGYGATAEEQAIGSALYIGKQLFPTVAGQSYTLATAQGPTEKEYWKLPRHMQAYRLGGLIVYRLDWDKASERTRKGMERRYTTLQKRAQEEGKVLGGAKEMKQIEERYRKLHGR